MQRRNNMVKLKIDNMEVEVDENGIINLGQWITNQRRNTIPESDRGQLLTKIGMRWNKKSNS